MIETLTVTQWITICLSAVLISMSKTGIQGITALTVPYMAIAFGAKESTGIILPKLCMADIIAVCYFRKKADWKAVVRLLPAAVAGFFIAIWVDDQIPASDFRFLLGITLLTVFLVMLWSEFTGSQNRWAHAWWFAPFFGLLGGFVTMIGNAAGAVMAIYLLSMRKEKMEFIGTNAWFFMVVNLLKLPLQILVWHNITFESFRLNLLMLPFLGLGACIGLRIVKRFSDQSFHRFIQIVTAFSVILMITR